MCMTTLETKPSATEFSSKLQRKNVYFLIFSPYKTTLGVVLILFYSIHGSEIR